MFLIKWTAVVIAIVVVSGIGIKAYGAWRWTESTKAMMARLEAARIPLSNAPYSPREIEGLSLPVQRYFRAVLTEGQPMVSAVTLTQSGTFNMNEAPPSWKPFTARQRVTTNRPGFFGMRAFPCFQA